MRKVKMWKKTKWLGLPIVLVLSFFAVKLFVFSFDETKESKVFREAFHDTYRIFPPQLPEDLKFAGEEVPVNDIDIHERLDREIIVNTYWQSNTLLSIKLAHRYFPVIEPILKEEGVPDDFKYLALIESGFRPAVSPLGAAGFWQFLEQTAPDYGMEVSSEVDERYNLEMATHAACRYLKEARNKFGSWTMAAASYNRGMQGIQNQVDLQKNNNYYDLYLNEETSRYVFRMLAMRELYTDPEKYGFMIRPSDFYPPIKTEKITVDTTINNLVDFALAHHIKYKTLKLLNPWLKKSSMANPKRKTYTISLPAKIQANRPFFTTTYRDSI
ncbi:MAG: lytic transglycosylase domain-containing protein [Flavobacteriales bacterium]|nr:lytic transglycosylase domain-containing protein [Flavobacteriales bacterium]